MPNLRLIIINALWMTAATQLPLPLVAAHTVASLLILAAPAQAQSNVEVGKIAEATTVRIEGATQGSGVIVSRDGNIYTVLTAWHVVEGQRGGEELDIYTLDGMKHQVDQRTIKRLGDIDMAVLKYKSLLAYETTRAASIETVHSGEKVYVVGFPRERKSPRFSAGILVAFASLGIDQGYQLLYTNETEPGMSGGALLNSKGEIIGIHGRGEIDNKSTTNGLLAKTGVNQGVPYSYYSQFISGNGIRPASRQASSNDDYLALSKSLSTQRGREGDAIKIATHLLSSSESATAYLIRGIAYYYMGAKEKSLQDYNAVLRLDQTSTSAYYNRGLIRKDLGDYRGAIEDADSIIAINSESAEAYSLKGGSLSSIGNNKEAYENQSIAIRIEPRQAGHYYNRAIESELMGNKNGAFADYAMAIQLNPKFASAYFNRALLRGTVGDLTGAIVDFTRTISIDPANHKALYNRAFFKHRINDCRGAVVDYGSSLAIFPNDVLAFANRGACREILGDKRGALADYAKGILIDPKEPSLYFNRGVLMIHENNRHAACTDWKYATKLGDAQAKDYYQRACI